MDIKIDSDVLAEFFGDPEIAYDHYFPWCNCYMEAGFPITLQHWVMHLNDSHELSFVEIADIIEKYIDE